MKSTFFGILTALVLSLSVSTVQAQNFSVGVENIDYFPLYSGADQGEYKGYARELLDAFAKSKGYTFTYKALPVNRLFKSFVDGELDFKFPDNPHWSESMRTGKNITYSDSTTQYIDGVFIQSNRKGMEQSQLKTLGLITGFTAWEYNDAIKAGTINVEESNNYRSLLMKAAQGRIDGAYSNVAVANYQMREVLSMSGQLEFAANLPHTKSDYFLSTLKHGDIISEFNAFMQANPTLVQELKTKYHTNDF